MNIKQSFVAMVVLATATVARADDKDFNGTFVAPPTRDGRSGTVQLSLKRNELTFVFTPRGGTAPAEDVTCVLGGEACQVRKAASTAKYLASRDGDAIIVEYSMALGAAHESVTQRTLRLTSPDELTMTWYSRTNPHSTPSEFKYARQQ